MHISSGTISPARLRDQEVGRRAFILANGPSVGAEDLSFLKGELVIGMNASTMLEAKHGFETSYYVVSDRRFLAAEEKRAWALEKLSSNTKRILRSDIRDLDENAYADRTTYVAPLSRDGFSTNLSHGYYYGCTTTLLALQLGWHLGIREVYLLGCDLRYAKDNPRFYREDSPQLEDAFTSVQLYNIVESAKLFEAAGGKLVNCSARSFLRPYLPFQSFDALFR